LERTIQDQQKKEGEYALELKSQKKDHQTAARDTQAKYDAQLKSLTTRFDEATEKLLEAQSLLEEIE
jgi:hypothetical protein